MAASNLRYLRTNPQIIFFTDFDGTITMLDSNDWLGDNYGYGVEQRRKDVDEVLEGKKTFREFFTAMLDSVNLPFNECVSILLKEIKLDPGFKAFYDFAKENNIPIVVLSSGLRPLIHALFVQLLGHEPDDHFTIVSNDIASRDGKDVNTPGGWQVKYHDDSHFGHDKSLEIKPYRMLPDDVRPTLLYAGDGVSDLSAASQTDLLFAKKGKDLVTYCERQGQPYTTFENWETILSTTRDIHSGNFDLKNAATLN